MAIQVCPPMIFYAIRIKVINYRLVVFLHGGPGGGTDPKDRQFFNPEKYKVSYTHFIECIFLFM
jgi:hypothetical protein